MFWLFFVLLFLSQTGAGKTYSMEVKWFYNIHDSAFYESISSLSTLLALGTKHSRLWKQEQRTIAEGSGWAFYGHNEFGETNQIHNQIINGDNLLILDVIVIDFDLLCGECNATLSS